MPPTFEAIDVLWIALSVFLVAGRARARVRARPSGGTGRPADFVHQGREKRGAPCDQQGGRDRRSRERPAGQGRSRHGQRRRRRRQRRHGRAGGDARDHAARPEDRGPCRGLSHGIAAFAALAQEPAAAPTGSGARRPARREAGDRGRAAREAARDVAPTRSRSRIPHTKPPYHGVARLVVGGLAARLDLSYEDLEDLQLALESVLERRRLCRRRGGHRACSSSMPTTPSRW